VSNKLSLSLEITADPAKLKAGLAVSRREIIANYAEIKAGVAEASKKLLETQTNAQALAKELGRSGPPTKAMVADFERARAAVVAAKAAVESKTLALQRQRSLAQANAEAITAATRAEQQAVVNAAAATAAAQRAAHLRRMNDLSQQIQASKASAAAIAVSAQAEAAAAVASQRRSLLLLPGIGGGSTAAIGAINSSAKGASDAVGGLQQRLNGVASSGAALAPVAGQISRIQAGVVAMLGTAVSVQGLEKLAGVADSYAAIESRVKLASTSFDDFKRAESGVYEISLKNGQVVTANASFYGSIARSVRNMGRETGDALAITEGLANSLKISRATTAESTASTLQFAQALRSGVLRGDEFNTVMEAAPRLAQALADGLRQPQDSLRALAEEGKLTSKAVVEALLSQSEALSREASSIQLTIGQAGTNMSTSFQRAFGERTASNALALAAGINTLANNMNGLIDVATLAGTTIAVVFGVRMLASISAAVAAKQVAIAAEREHAAAALLAAQANVRAAAAEEARTLSSRGLAAAQIQLAAAERTASIAASGIATRASVGLLGMLGGPIGAIATALTLGLTAWQLWGGRSEEATGKASRSLSDLIKDLREFGANMSAAEKMKQFEALAEAIAKARSEEVKLRAEAAQRVMSDMNVATKAQAASAVESDPAVVAKVAERLAAEKALQDELGAINKKASAERQFLMKALVDKQKALNGEVVVDEKKALEERQKDHQKAADAVRSAWQKSLDEIKSKQDEVSSSQAKAADRAASLNSRIDQARTSGMSDDDKAAYSALQAQELLQAAATNRTRASFELTKAYSQQLRGELDAAKKSFDSAEKDLDRAFNQAEKAGDVGAMDEIASRLVDIENQRGKMAAAEVAQLQDQAEGQRAKMAELEATAIKLQNKLLGMEVDVKIDTAIEKIKTLQTEAMRLQTILAGATAGTPSQAVSGSDIPGRAYGGPIPGWSPHARADNILMWATAGEYMVQQPTMQQPGARSFMDDFNLRGMSALKRWAPGYAFGGQIGSNSAISRLRVPSISGAASNSQLAGMVLDFSAFGAGKHTVQAPVNVQREVQRAIKMAALRRGKK